MARTMHITLLAAVLAITTLAGAQARAELKIGYVDLQRAIAETEEGKKAKAELKRIFQKKQEALNKQQDELKKAQEDYESKRLLMTPEARAKAESELKEKYVALQTALMTHQKDLSKREAQVMQKILAKMERILREIGESQGFTLILEKGESRILYALPSMDLTNEVIRRYNDMK